MSENSIAVRSVEIVTAEIITIRNHAQKVFIDAVIGIGRRLEEAKSLVPAGGWLDYLEGQLGYKPSTAQNYMRIAREFGGGQMNLNGKTATDVFGALGYSQLLPLLGMPEDEREEIAEEHDLGAMSAREIAALVKERDDARARADDAAHELTAANDMLAQQDKDEKDAADKAKAAAEQAKEAERRAAALQKQLDEMTEKASRPAEVSEEQLAALRDEAKAEQAEAVAAAEARAREAAEKLEKVKNPAAHQVNFLFGELAQTHKRLAAAVAELGKSDAAAAEKMREAINRTVQTWAV